MKEKVPRETRLQVDNDLVNLEEVIRAGEQNSLSRKLDESKVREELTLSKSNSRS
jgi:hypothetical protein